MAIDHLNAAKARLIYYSRRAKDELRDGGLGILLWRILVKLLAPLGELSIDILYERDLGAEIAPISARADLTIRHATEADIDAILALEEWPVSEDSEAADEDGENEDGEDALSLVRRVYRDRLARGEICFLAYVGAELVHSNWMCRKWGEAVPGHPVVLLPGEIYETDAFTAQAWRRYGIQKFVHNEMLRFAQSSGYRRAYTMANFERLRSRKGSLRLGYTRYGVVLWFLPRRTWRIVMIRLSGRLDILFRQYAARPASERPAALNTPASGSEPGM
ncbi:MAG TPA: hypothetical protein VKY65_02160 [Alphaproteobacteria bacterium]|nr:hypothetical protein [Alphaproteobacteria bacterium]